MIHHGWGATMTQPRQADTAMTCTLKIAGRPLKITQFKIEYTS